eukprot:TRINITY_DN13962_c0_g2_i1.p1 TRINITY_DN13962_c0_g2~~TRINITY_DN13962_c0_g2_i1.p1  ORF type:complete len:223 (-),score=38.51 TRINITY_DN13962_c0_g2_i1:273-941(-)
MASCWFSVWYPMESSGINAEYGRGGNLNLIWIMATVAPPASKMKVVVMGSGGVGKSALSVQYTRRVFLKKYDPTIEETYMKQVDVDGNAIMLEIMDTAGTEQFTAMRDLYIKEGDGFLLVFSLVSDGTLVTIEKLVEQISKVKDDDKVPVTLVGNKADLVEKRQVEDIEARQIADRFCHGHYLEASAKTFLNVTESFEDVIRQILAGRPVVKPPRTRGCVIF